MADKKDRSISREEEWRLVRQATPKQQKAIMDQLARSYQEVHGENTVNEKQKARVTKAAQKTTGLTQIQHANPLHSTQDRVKESLARATQERMRATMEARQQSIAGRNPLHQETTARRSPTNGLPPMDKSRDTVQDSPKRGVSMDKE
jgi:hypothetical protein